VSLVRGVITTISIFVSSYFYVSVLVLGSSQRLRASMYAKDAFNLVTNPAGTFRPKIKSKVCGVCVCVGGGGVRFRKGGEKERETEREFERRRGSG
jgi:hypothetical protein